MPAGGLTDYTHNDLTVYKPERHISECQHMWQTVCVFVLTSSEGVTAVSHCWFSHISLLANKSRTCSGWCCNTRILPHKVLSAAFYCGCVIADACTAWMQIMFSDRASVNPSVSSVAALQGWDFSFHKFTHLNSKVLLLFCNIHWAAQYECWRKKEHTDHFVLTLLWLVHPLEIVNVLSRFHDNLLVDVRVLWKHQGSLISSDISWQFGSLLLRHLAVFQMEQKNTTPHFCQGGDTPQADRRPSSYERT